MTLTQAEFDAILADSSKIILEDIEWKSDEDHSPSLECRAAIDTGSGYPLFFQGRYNPFSQTLSYTLFHRAAGRIYALDMGKDHRNPDGERVGELHKHRYNEKLRDKEAYRPTDITAKASDPVDVWKQFCSEAGIVHQGKMKRPSSFQGDLFL